MTTIKETISTIKDDLSYFDDELEKYDYIIDLGKKLTDIDDSLKTEENLVHGCTSQVWLITDIQNNKLIITGTSDAIIVKGLVYIILEIFNNKPIPQIQEFDINILSELGLAEIITPNRQSGVQGMIQKIMEVSKNARV